MFAPGVDLKIDPTLDDLTEEQLRHVMPRCDVATWLPLLNSAMGRFGIVTPQRVAAFLSQIAHESGECRSLSENLSYSAERLLQVWPSRFFDLADARTCERNPSALANRVYSNRLGNGNNLSGDGWLYRGSGLIQLTGKANCAAAEAGTGHQIVKHPDTLRAPGAAAADSAAWYWSDRHINDLADQITPDNILQPLRAITRRINGGVHGFDQRLAYFERARGVLL